MGVAQYNAACRGIVKRYSEEWKTTVRRIGRWVDMDHPYFTMDVAFMQSVWWVFKELFQKGLIYDGYKVVPYSTGISTSLSNFEANLNYKMVQDPAVTVIVPGAERTQHRHPGVDHHAVDFAVEFGPRGGRRHRLRQSQRARDRPSLDPGRGAAWASVFKDHEKETEIVARMKGSELIDLTYEPLFTYFSDRAAKGAFRVVPADHVTTESGTGIVHMAPAYGEEDYVACARAGIELVNPVDDDGMFTEEVPDFAGQRVKDADKGLIAEIKKKGRLFKHDVLEHSYPFCYRSDTPLIYRAVSSWFVAVEKIKDRLVKNNQQTSWVPDHLRDGRFGKWLDNARDWAISRNRFWGTPLPLWRNREGESDLRGLQSRARKVLGTQDRRSARRISSTTSRSPPPPVSHRLKPRGRRVGLLVRIRVDALRAVGLTRRRTPPRSKTPFPPTSSPRRLDQTRGWFYTLVGDRHRACSTKRRSKTWWSTAWCLAEDGRKMSKSLRNYPGPDGGAAPARRRRASPVPDQFAGGESDRS